MEAALNFWTPSSSRSFHTSVAKLRKVTRNPPEPQFYRGSTTPDPDGHVLSLGDELQMADNLAYLAHWEENVRMISAVTLEEHPSGLVVVLASNSTPSQSIIAGLRDILATVCQYCTLRKKRQEFCRSLFLKVLQLSQRRILGRIRPPWIQQPSHIRKKRPFLKVQLLDLARQLKKRLAFAPQLLVTYDQVCGLIDSLEPLSRRLEHDDINRALEHVIMKCASIAAVGNMHSLEEHLKSHGVPSVLYDASEVRQIDKLARYLFLCKDFLRLARKPEYRTLFNHIDVTALKAYSATKSACYLCDLFILKQSRYHVSHAHRRLYEQWTIPDVDWMTEAQACTFRAIIQDMIQHMNEATRFRQARAMPWGLDPLESKAFLPLSSGSTVSSDTVVLLSSRVSSHSAYRLSPPSDRQESSVVITSADLPFQSKVGIGREPLDVQIDQLHVSFEFVSISAGWISVRRTTQLQDPSNRQLMSVEASTIPTDDEIKVPCDPKTSQVRFQLRHGPQLCIEVGFLWEKVE
ncbi:hypothetical protein HYQ44_010213 [Verticillium longisporum]|nr:hypothetical protein HYQ44_010213 [Verticillium longisporum]